MRPEKHFFNSPAVPNFLIVREHPHIPDKLTE